MNCDICAAPATMHATIEGAPLSVCAPCARSAKDARPIPLAMKRSAKPSRKPAQTKPQKIVVIVSDYAQRIRAARQKRGLGQEDFAKLIAEKESVVRKLERKSIDLEMALAKKLERVLGIVLVEERDEEKVPKGAAARTGPLTIGDIMAPRWRTSSGRAQQKPSS